MSGGEPSSIKWIFSCAVGLPVLSWLRMYGSSAGSNVGVRSCYEPVCILKGYPIKKIIAFLLLVVLSLSLALFTVGCNKQMVDMTYSYEYAIISLPNGEVVEGKVSSWTDFEDGDQIQVKINGKTYLVHSSNIVLISD